MLLVGFVGAFRRSELAAMERTHAALIPKGLVITIPRSKTDPYGEGQLVVMPYSSRPQRCPVVSRRAWMDAAGIGTDIDDGDEPLVARTFVFRPVHRNGTSVAARGMSLAAINNAVQRACRLALGPDGTEYPFH